MSSCSSASRWVILLAAGDGSRLRELTRDAKGVAVPKQYCSLPGGDSLLGLALRRARRLVPPERIVTVVAEQHRRWWGAELAALAPEQILVQPANRGTAAGLLLPLLAVHRRDAQAEVAVLPCDHFVAREDLFGEALEVASAELASRPERIVLLGIEPEVPDAGLGWIVPAGRAGMRAADDVAAFLEKPPLEVAGRLIAQGALVNSFVMVGRGAAFLELLQRHSDVLEPFRAWLDGEAPGAPQALARLYARLPERDLSRDVLQRACERLAVVRVPACGWTDLGTPDRVQACLQRSSRDASIALQAGPWCRLPGRGSDPPIVLDRRVGGM